MVHNTSSDPVNYVLLTLKQVIEVVVNSVTTQLSVIKLFVFYEDDHSYKSFFWTFVLGFLEVE